MGFFPKKKSKDKMQEIRGWEAEGYKLTIPSVKSRFGRNRKWNMKYQAEKANYQAWKQGKANEAAYREEMNRRYGKQARKLARKRKTVARVTGPASPKASMAQGSGTNTALYRRRGKTSLIQRAVQTGLVRSGNGTQIPK